MATCALSRLTDRIETDDAGKEVQIPRYGVWGSNLEIERRGPKRFVVRMPRGKEETFRSLDEAEHFILLTNDRLFTGPKTY